MKPRELLHRLPVRLLVVMACGMFGKAHAENALDDWQIAGSNTLRLEHYNVQGDPLAGPYRYTGGQRFDEFNLNFLRQVTPFDKLSAQLYGVANDSAYRAPNRGFVPERANITREKGDGGIPYRAEAGDYFANFSLRTLQRSLKGAQIELQPLPNEAGTRQSVVLTSGINQPNWRQVQDKNDWINGVSWLAETSPQTHFGANLIHNSRSADSGLGTPERKQTVASLTGDHAWESGSQALRVEGELADFRGDYAAYIDASGVSQNGLNRHGNGAFAQLSGKAAAGPLDYRLRYERYGSDYRPVGAVVTPGREAEEAHAGWNFASGLTLRGRAQHFVDGLQSGNELKTTTYGLNWAGPFLANSINGLSGSIDLFQQDLVKRDKSIDRGTWNLNANFAKPLPADWVSTFSLFLQQANDRVPGAADMHSGQLQLGATHALDLGGWSGSFTPGITLRRVAGGISAVKECSPSLAFVFAKNKHSISANYGYQRLKPDLTSLATIDVNALRVDYRYTDGQDTFGVEASAYNRKVTVGQFNDTYRGSVFWTHTFDKPAHAAARSVALAPAQTPMYLPHDINALLDIKPGDDLETTLKRLAVAGFHGGIRQADTVIYEAPLLDEISQRQRFAIEHGAGRITRVALVVNLDDTDNAQAVSQTYERVRRALLDRFGNPSLNYEEGEIAPTLTADLSAGRIIRTTEWRTGDGTLRLGIPRRLDGQVRIDIQHANRFGAPRDALWGMDAVL